MNSPGFLPISLLFFFGFSSTSQFYILEYSRVPSSDFYLIYILAPRRNSSRTMELNTNCTWRFLKLSPSPSLLWTLYLMTTCPWRIPISCQHAPQTQYVQTTTQSHSILSPKRSLRSPISGSATIHQVALTKNPKTHLLLLSFTPYLIQQQILFVPL